MRTVSVIFLALFLFSSGCTRLPDGIACTTLYAYGVGATVTDTSSGVPIDNATLTLSEDDYQEVMETFQDGNYVGAGERAGTYSLTASAPGYQTQTIENIIVTADVCHVHGVHVDVQLVAAP